MTLDSPLYSSDPALKARKVGPDDDAQALSGNASSSCKAFIHLMSNLWSAAILPCMTAAREYNANKAKLSSVADTQHNLFQEYMDSIYSLSSDDEVFKKDLQKFNVLALEFGVPPMRKTKDLSAISWDGKELIDLHRGLSSCWTKQIPSENAKEWYQGAWNLLHWHSKNGYLYATDDWKVMILPWTTRDSLLKLQEDGWTRLSSFNLSAKFTSEDGDLELQKGWHRSPWCYDYSKLMLYDHQTTPLQDASKYEFCLSTQIAFATYLGKSLPPYSESELGTESALVDIDWYDQDQRPYLSCKQEFERGLGLQFDTCLTSYPQLPVTQCSAYNPFQKISRWMADGYGQTYTKTDAWHNETDFDFDSPRVCQYKMPFRLVQSNLRALGYYTDKVNSLVADTGTKAYYAETEHFYVPQRICRKGEICTYRYYEELSVGREQEVESGKWFIGTVTCTQTKSLSSTGGWQHYDTYNQIKYDHGTTHSYTMGSIGATGGMTQNFGALSGGVSYNGYKVTITDPTGGTAEGSRYVSQLVKLFPRSPEQQKKDALEAISAEYLPQISALEEQISAKQEEVSAAYEAVQEELSSAMNDALAVAMREIYNADNLQEISSFDKLDEYLNNVPSTRMLSGHTIMSAEMYEVDEDCISCVNEYLSAVPELSSLGPVADIDDLISRVGPSIEGSQTLSSYAGDVIGSFLEPIEDGFENSLGVLDGAPYTQQQIDTFLDNTWEFIREQYDEHASDPEIWGHFQELYAEWDQLVAELEVLEMRLDELWDEYLQKLADAEEKEYKVVMPDLATLDLLYSKPYHGEVVYTTEGNGFQTFTTEAVCNADTGDEGWALSDEQWTVYNGDDGTDAWPYALGNQQNNSYQNTRYAGFAKADLKTNSDVSAASYVLPVGGKYDTFDKFRKDGWKAAKDAMKDKVGFSSKNSWYIDLPSNLPDPMSQGNISCYLKLDEGCEFSFSIVQVLPLQTVQVHSDGGDFEGVVCEITGANSILNVNLGTVSDTQPLGLSWTKPGEFAEEISYEEIDACLDGSVCPCIQAYTELGGLKT